MQEGHTEARLTGGPDVRRWLRGALPAPGRIGGDGGFLGFARRQALRRSLLLMFWGADGAKQLRHACDLVNVDQGLAVGAVRSTRRRM